MQDYVDQIKFEVRISILDIIALAISLVFVFIYMWTDNWMLNNVIAIAFSVHAIEMLFLGNFQVGMLLLSLLFFYDIFFVFGTDIMLTVAKGIKAPIKILFPTKYKEDGTREFNLLGLGDIVLPGVFIALALRFDVLKSLDKNWVDEMIASDKAIQVHQKMVLLGNNVTKKYFLTCLLGYVMAISLTIAIMVIFDHGQPALLYLVPGVLLAVILTSFFNGEFNTMWEHSEDKYLGATADEDKDGEKSEEKKETSETPVKETKQD